MYAPKMYLVFVPKNQTCSLNGGVYIRVDKVLLLLRGVVSWSISVCPYSDHMDNRLRQAMSKLAVMQKRMRVEANESKQE